MTRIEAVICDFGGVLSSPLLDAFLAYERDSEIPLQELGTAMLAIAERSGENPLYALETGRLSAAEFLGGLSAQLSRQLDREVTMDDFADRYFDSLEPNEPMIEFMRALKARGYRLAILTNNVREWEPLWRAKLPVDEIFEDVVDSGFVGLRKPDPAIFELTLSRLGCAASAALMLDDVEDNCAAARAVGMQAVCFGSTEQAIADVEAALAGS